MKTNHQKYQQITFICLKPTSSVSANLLLTFLMPIRVCKQIWQHFKAKVLAGLFINLFWCKRQFEAKLLPSLISFLVKIKSNYVSLAKSRRCSLAVFYFTQLSIVSCIWSVGDWLCEELSPAGGSFVLLNCGFKRKFASLLQIVIVYEYLTSDLCIFTVNSNNNVITKKWLRLNRNRFQCVYFVSFFLS